MWICRNSVHDETPKRIPGRHSDVLLTVQHVGLRCVRDITDSRVPHRSTRARVMRHEVSRSITGEQQTARGCQESPAAAVPVPGMSPDHLARLVIDSRQIVAAGSYTHLFLAPEAHRTARIDVG